jgi:hypothetical protein
MIQKGHTSEHNSTKIHKEKEIATKPLGSSALDHRNKPPPELPKRTTTNTAEPWIRRGFFAPLALCRPLEWVAKRRHRRRCGLTAGENPGAPPIPDPANSTAETVVPLRIRRPLTTFPAPEPHLTCTTAPSGRTPTGHLLLYRLRGPATTPELASPRRRGQSTKSSTRSPPPLRQPRQESHRINPPAAITRRATEGSKAHLFAAATITAETATVDSRKPSRRANLAYLQTDPANDSAPLPPPTAPRPTERRRAAESPAGRESPSGSPLQWRRGTGAKR